MWTVSCGKFCPNRIRSILGGDNIETMLKNCKDKGVPVNYVNMWTYKDGVKTIVPTFEIGMPVVATVYNN